MKKVQKTNISVNVILTMKEDGVVVNLASVTTKEIVFRKPDGTTVTKSAAFVTDGADGKIKYATESGFLDQTGVWELQPHFVFPGGGFTGRGEVVQFVVKDNL